MKETAFKILAWFGLLIIVLSLPFAFLFSWVWTNQGFLGAGFGYLFTFIGGIVGTLIVLVFGFIAKPKYFWIGAIVVGCLYIVSFYGYVNDLPRFILKLFLSMLPGMMCIAGGIIIQKISLSGRKASNN